MSRDELGVCAHLHDPQEELVGYLPPAEYEEAFYACQATQEPLAALT